MVVIARLDRGDPVNAALNYHQFRWLLDAPLEPVIGLAEGETRWRA
jgi:hypothetical protein